MKKEEFVEICEEAIRYFKGIKVSVTIPGNVCLEKISNAPVDVKNKLGYYCKTYNDEMQHKFAEGIAIVGVDLIGNGSVVERCDTE